MRRLSVADHGQPDDIPKLDISQVDTSLHPPVWSVPGRSPGAAETQLPCGGGHGAHARNERLSLNVRRVPAADHGQPDDIPRVNIAKVDTSLRPRSGRDVSSQLPSLEVCTG